MLAVLLVNLLTPASHSAIDALRFVSLEGGFSISLPERFKQQTRLIVPTPSGGAYGKLYEWRVKDQVFSIGYADRFEPISDAEAVKQFFDGLTEHFRGFAVSVNVDACSVKKTTLDKHSGIEQRADINTGAFIQRTYLASRKTYQRAP